MFLLWERISHYQTQTVKNVTKKWSLKDKIKDFNVLVVEKKLQKKYLLKFQEKSKNNFIFQKYLHIDISLDRYNELEQSTNLQNLINLFHGFMFIEIK